MKRPEISFKGAATLVLFVALLAVYLNTIGDLPGTMVAPNYNIGQLTP